MKVYKYVSPHFIFVSASHHSLNLDLQYVLKSSSMFKENSEMPIECLMKKSEDLSEEIKQEREDEISFEEPLIQYNYEESEDSDYSPEKDIKTEVDLFCEKSSTLNDSRPASTSSGGGKEGLRRLAKQFLLNDEGSDSEEDDKSMIGGKKQKVKEKRRLYKQAIEAIARYNEVYKYLCAMQAKNVLVLARWQLHRTHGFCQFFY